MDERAMGTRSSTHGAAANVPAPPGVMRRHRVMRLIARMNIGGPAIHVALLTQRLDRERFQSVLVTGVEAPGEGNMLELMGETLNTDLRPIVLPGLGREISPRNDLKTLRQVIRLMRRSRPDIVHTHTAKAGFVGRLAARFAGVPIVVHTFHGNVFKGYFSPRKTQIFIAIERFLARRTDRIIVLSEQQKQEILGLGIGREEQFRIVPLGLDLKPFLDCDSMRGELRRELRLSPGTHVVGIVARLVPIKSIHLLLQAAPQVLKRFPDTVFLIVGDGELRADLEAEAARLDLNQNARFLGFRADLPLINADLDCAVLCSQNEGLPVAVIEALASARAVVATDVGGVSDLIRAGETGWLVPPNDVDALANGIIEALGDKQEAARRGSMGRAHVYPRLDISRLVGDIETLYCQCLREKGMMQ